MVIMTGIYFSGITYSKLCYWLWFVFMIYVLWLVLDGSPCRGGGGGLCCYLVVHIYMFGFDAAICCPWWPSRDVKVMFYNLTGDFRSHFINKIKNYFFQQTLYHCLRVVRPVEYIYFCIIIMIMFDFVCDRLGSPSDLVKSWGGVWLSHAEYLGGDWAYGSQCHLVHVIWGARSSHSAVSTGAYKGRETQV